MGYTLCMNISQNVLVVVVAGLTIVLVPMVIMALSFVVAYKKGNYSYCVAVVRRMPFIVDANGIITPEMVSAAAIRAHDYQLAAHWLAKATRQGILPVHRLLELSLLADQSQWDKAAQIFALLSDEATNSTQDDDSEARDDMKELAQYIETRNATKIDELGRKLI